MNEICGLPDRDSREKPSVEDSMEKVKVEFDEVFRALFEAGQTHERSNLSHIVLKKEDGTRCWITLSIWENNYRSMSFYDSEVNPGGHFTLEEQDRKYKFILKIEKHIYNVHPNDHIQYLKNDIDENATAEDLLEKYLPKFRSLLDLVKDGQKKSKWYINNIQSVLAQILYNCDGPNTIQEW